jgi:hypothetical protein
MKSTRRIALLAPALAALAARPAAAQEIHSHIRYVDQAQGLGFFAGWVFSDPKVTLNDSTQVEMAPQSAPIFGVQYQVRASGPLSIATSLGYIPSTRKVFLAEAVNDSTAIRAIDTGREANVGILLFDAGMLFHLTGPRTYRGLAPFVGARVGYARQISGKDAQDSLVAVGERYRFGPSFAVSAHLGSDVFLTRTLSVRAELAGRLWRESPPVGFRAAGVTKLSEWNNASSAQIGAVLHF